MLKKLAFMSLIAGVLVLSAPTVAAAAQSGTAPLTADPYTAPPNVTVDRPVIDVCEAATIVFGAGYFLPGESVSVGSAPSGVATAAFSSGMSGASGDGARAGADGGMVFSFQPPSTADASYNITFTGSRTYTTTITVSRGHDPEVTCDTDPLLASPNTELPSTGGIELALTGGSMSAWIVGGGVLALAIGGALVIVGVTRRNRT